MSEFKQLNKPKWVTALNWLTSCCTIVACCLAVCALFKYPVISEDETAKIFAWFLISLVTIVLCYIGFHSRKRYNYYARCGTYYHQVAHIFRDSLAQLQDNGNLYNSEEAGRDAFISILEQALDSISEMLTFSIGKKCSVSFKEIKRTSPEPPAPQNSHSKKKKKKKKVDASKETIDEETTTTIITLARDRGSRQTRINTLERGAPSPHAVENNTDFHQLFSKIDNMGSSFFACNDLKKLWCQNGYSNSSFLIYGEPTFIPLLEYKYITRWPLPYKSTMVFPVRYDPKDKTKIPRHCGFLCFDSPHKNAFNLDKMPDIGASFADLFYIFITQYYSITQQYVQHDRNFPPNGEKQNEKQSQANNNK